MLAAAERLIAERGVARLTTKDVARLAGVAEGSIFYHFTDRAGLMAAVIRSGIGSFDPLREPDGLLPGDLRGALTRFADLMAEFLDRSLPVMIAAQSDAELRSGLRAELRDQDMGPHQGIALLAGYLRSAQETSAVSGSVDCDAIAYLFYGACFQRAALRLMLGADYGGNLASTTQLVDATVALLSQ